METKMEITAAEAKRLYEQSNEAGKKILIEKFGEPFFSIKWPSTIEEIIELANPGENERNLLSYDGIKPRMIGAKNHLLAEMICDVLNGDWKQDLSDKNQRRWFPLFDPQGVGFSDSVYDNWFAYTTAGSRLCFKDKATADYAGQTFPEIFRALIHKNPTKK